MPEPVIVATARTPIGRAFKGSLVNERADDMAAFIVDTALNKVPELDRTTVDDLMLGCGLPGGEQGFNMGRVVAVLAGMRKVPGCTITRYCSSSLQTMRMAAHAIKAGEGDVFIAAGVEAVSRFMVGGSSDHTPNTQNPKFAAAHERSVARAAGDQGPGLRPRVCPTSTSTWVRPRRTSPRSRTSRARRWTSTRCSRSSVAARRSSAGSSSGRSRRSRPADGTVVTKDDGPRPDTTLEKLASLKPAFRPNGRVTAGNACPLNDGAAAVIVMSDTKANELGVVPSRASSPAASPASTPRSWASARSKRAARRWPARG